MFTWEFIEAVRKNLLLRRVLGFSWHVAGIIICYAIAFFLRLDSWELFLGTYGKVYLKLLPVALANFIFFIVVFGLYRGLWSFVSFRDCVRYAWVYALAVSLYAGWVFLFLNSSYQGHPRLVFPIYYFLLVAWEIGGRAVFRLLRDYQQQQADGGLSLGPSTILVGDPEHCDQLVRSLINPRMRMGVVRAIVCEDKGRTNATLHGIRLHGDLDSVGQVAKEVEAEMVLILPPFVTPNAIKRIMGHLADEEVSAEYRVIPSLKDIAEGHVDVSSLRRVEIEDLLNRKPNEFDRTIIESFLKGKTVMVTGAGGSIGAEICRQVLKYEPAKLILFDSSEYNLFEIHRELETLEVCPLSACLGDVKSEVDVMSAMEEADGVEIVYHAAAYKHVHLAEKNVAAVMSNNVLGSACVAEVAARMGVKQFILVSTDKAVRPTSVMGASKRLAERCLLERPKNGTEFKAVRFGNVLGSSGSVIPIFKKQIAEGGPVTVTSKNVTRYFMTIPEAVELVLMAGAVGEDRNIMVLEMGNPVRIDLLARQLIELSGLVPDKDIEIQYTGLRKGEKEYEELLTEDENVVQTAYDKIWVMEKEESNMKPLDLKKIAKLTGQNNNSALRKLAIDLIPGNQLEAE